jgi:hypothetical protein
VLKPSKLSKNTKYFKYISFTVFRHPPNLKPSHEFNHLAGRKGTHTMNNELQQTELSTLAIAINQANRQAQESAEKAVTYAIECGKSLIAAKALVNHGAWTAWLKTNCHVSQRSAQNYMKLAAEYPNTQRVADLSLRKTIKLLSEPKKDNQHFADAEPPIIHDEADWRPKGDTLGVVFSFSDPAYGPLYLQEISSAPGYYQHVFFEDNMGIINFNKRGYHFSAIEPYLKRVIPGRLCYGDIKSLPWEFLENQHDVVTDMIKPHIVLEPWQRR